MENFESYLKEKQRLVEETLEKLLPKAEGKHAKIHEAMRYSVLAGGKRLRPTLCLAAYEIFKADSQPILPAACALELIHSYSLVHDDLPCMDDDDLRRGKPTNHKVYGEAIAVLSGDALLTLAFEWMSQIREIEPSFVLKASSLLALLSGTEGMIGGQVQDIEAEGKEVSIEELESIHLCKTAALIKASVSIGAVLGGATQQEQQQLALFAEKIGLSFQIIDDLLDLEGSTERLGKTAKKDLLQEKATYPSLLGVEPSRELAKKLFEEGIAALDSFGEKGAPLKSLAQYVIARQH